MTKFSLTNFTCQICKLGGFDKFILNKHLTHEICQRKFVPVKEASV